MWLLRRLRASLTALVFLFYVLFLVSLVLLTIDNETIPLASKYRHRDMLEPEKQRTNIGEIEEEPAQIRTHLDENCRDIFYDGFTKQIPVCDDNSTDCRFHPTLLASVCEIQNVLIRRQYIQVSPGNESIDAVSNRNGREELPEYRKGAFELGCDTISDKLSGNLHMFSGHTQGMAHSFTTSPNPRSCSATIAEPVLAITRVDYANLYHTMTDWYNVFQVAHFFNLNLTQIRVLFFDGHSQSAMDDVWTHAFSNVQYISATPKDACYKRLYIVHPGINSPLSHKLINFRTLNCIGEPHLLKFSRFILDSFKIIDPPPVPSDRFDILFILRRDYIAHPRSRDGIASRKIANEEEVIHRLEQELPIKSFNILPRYFDSVSMRDQLQLVRNATVIIGVHGAGLSHVVFARPGTRLLELKDPIHKDHAHFEKFSQFANVTYNRIDIGREDSNKGHWVDPDELAKTVKSFFRLNLERNVYEQNYF